MFLQWLVGIVLDCHLSPSYKHIANLSFSRYNFIHKYLSVAADVVVVWEGRKREAVESAGLPEEKSSLQTASNPGSVLNKTHLDCFSKLLAMQIPHYAEPDGGGDGGTQPFPISLSLVSFPNKSWRHCPDGFLTQQQQKMYNWQRYDGDRSWDGRFGVAAICAQQALKTLYLLVLKQYVTQMVIKFV